MFDEDETGNRDQSRHKLGQILGAARPLIAIIEETGDDKAIKKAYLAKVRQYPPEQAPAQFQKIRAAYEAVRTERDRMAYRLFHHDIPDKDELRELVIGAATPQAVATMARKLTHYGSYGRLLFDGETTFGWRAATDVNWEVADDFSLSAGSNVVSHVEWWGSYGSGNTPQAIDDFRVEATSGLGLRQVSGQSRMISSSRATAVYIKFGLETVMG